MNLIYTRTVTILPSQVDAWGNLSLPHAFDLFMDTATEAAGAMGVGWDFLIRKGLFWITVKARVRFIDPPRLLDTVDVVTWPEAPDDMRCKRHYEIRKDGQVLAQGLTEWAIVSVQTGKPQPLADILPAELEYPDQAACPGPFPMIDGDFADPPFAHHLVTNTDIDMARHMNNVAYVRAIVNAFPLKAWKTLNVRQMDVIFLASAHEGDMLRFQQRREASPLGRREASPLGRREASPLGRREASPLGRRSDGVLDIKGTLPDGRVSVLARLMTKE